MAPDSDVALPDRNAAAADSDVTAADSDAAAPACEAVTPDSDAMPPDPDAAPADSDAVVPDPDVMAPGCNAAAPASDGAIERLRLASEAAGEASAQSGAKITIVGSVTKPGSLPVLGDQGLALSEALYLAGGLTGIADRRVVVNHRNDDGTIDKQAFDVRQIANGKISEPKVYGNDVVVVFARTK